MILRLLTLYVSIMLTLIMLSIISVIAVDLISFRYRRSSFASVSIIIGMMLVVIVLLALFIFA